MPRQTLILADDHELMARGLANLLAPHHDVVAVVHSGAELLDTLDRQQADCVLLDLSMPGQSGLDVLPTLARRWPDLRVMMLTMHADRALADATMALGAAGYVTKDAQLPEVLTAIERICGGGRYITPRIPKHTESISLHAQHPALCSLTRQQERILLLVGEGRSSAEIAEEVGLTESTIAFHRSNLRKKLGIESEMGLYQFALLIRTAVAETGETAAGEVS